MTIFILNDDCLEKIFEFLELHDCLNVAETCKRFAGAMDPVFTKRFSSLDAATIQGNTDRALRHIGSHLESLCVGQDDRTTDIIAKASKCVSLKSLFIHHWKLKPKLLFSQLTDFQYVESLTMKCCYLLGNVNFFSKFPNIKYLNLILCHGVHNRSLRDFFQNNTTIESFTFFCIGFNKFPLGALTLLPKLERVYFQGLVESPEYLKQLWQLNSLKKLKISTRHITKKDNLSNALLGMDFLEELEIRGYTLTENTFASLQRFEKLELLGLTFHVFFMSDWKPTYILPTSLISLKLENAVITAKQIASIIHELPKLKHLFIRQRRIMDGNKQKIDDFSEIVQRIFDALKHSYNLRILDVTLINEKYSTEEMRFGGLRIFGRHPNKISFGIEFPGL